MSETRLQTSKTHSSITFDENKGERFRILIIGNDDAVKSTIFQKVCNSGGLKDRMGNLISADLQAHGEHNIEKEIVHPADVGFVFHNSCGFEPGDSDELTKVTEFIAERVGRTDLRDRLHAIWYCLPSGDRSSTLLPTAMEFIKNAAAEG
ncbi:hypothetical protein PILCRDRAFT_825408 [Piloderma croceum F 1598]|uniref:G domain-containing protein n=1 Tax=Piloderma croceum (strain F 1598) TaxID=765440 RepID=A0A0C3AU22_PILCF|nr:hypothetical protein PILCRDRAFT_825408 [Piloderma croceum F 1598]